MRHIYHLDQDTSPKENMRALNDMLKCGRMRYIGASLVRRGAGLVNLEAAKG